MNGGGLNNCTPDQFLGLAPYTAQYTLLLQQGVYGKKSGTALSVATLTCVINAFAVKPFDKPFPFEFQPDLQKELTTVTTSAEAVASEAQELQKIP